jgi:preprotein translocase subunit SecA
MLQYLVTAEEITDPSRTPDLERIVDAVDIEGQKAFDRKVAYLSEFGRTVNVPDVDSQILSQVMLGVLDEKWKDHLYDLDQLRTAIQYRAYGQKDPLVEYKREAFEMFEDLMRDIQVTFTERFLKIQVTAEPAPRPAPPRRPPPSPTPSGTDDLFSGALPATPNGPPTPPPPPGLRSNQGALNRGMSSVPEVGRNEPCPCGSGKKYKKCHGRA